MTTRKEPWHPAPWEVSTAHAVKALARGDASPEQQRAALDWIIKEAASTYDEPFVPGQADVSDYLCGRRSVGLQVVKLINIDLARIEQAKRDAPSTQARRGQGAKQ